MCGVLQKQRLPDPQQTWLESQATATKIDPSVTEGECQ